MEPHAVIETGGHEDIVVPAHRMRGQDRVEEAHVARVGDDAGVQERIVGQMSVGPDPELLAGLLVVLGTPRDFTDESLVNWVLALEPFVVATKFSRSEEHTSE